MARSFGCGTDGGRGAGVSLTASRLGAAAGFAPGLVGLAAFPVAAAGFAGGGGLALPAPLGGPFFGAPLTPEEARTDAVRTADFAGRVTFATDLAGFFAVGLATTRAADFGTALAGFVARVTFVDFAGFDDLTGFALTVALTVVALT